MILIDKRGHLISDKSLDELHKFAQRMGMKREWFQDKRIPHYDVTTYRMRHRAALCGANFYYLTRW